METVIETGICDGGQIEVKVCHSGRAVEQPVARAHASNPSSAGGNRSCFRRVAYKSRIKCPITSVEAQK